MSTKLSKTKLHAKGKLSAIDILIKKQYLEEMDVCDDIFFLSVESRYSELIGSLVINFNYLDHTINYVIAEFLDKNNFKIGYILLENLNFNQKIALFYKLYSTSINDSEIDRIELKSIRAELIRIKTFRNDVVHADWQTMDREYFVRTKIISDSLGGPINLKVCKMTTGKIKANISRIPLIESRILVLTAKLNGLSWE